MKLIIELTKKDVLDSIKELGDTHDRKEVEDIIGDDVTLTLDNVSDSIGDSDTSTDARNLLSLVYLLGNKKWQEMTD